MYRLGSKCLIPTVAVATILLSSLMAGCTASSSPSRSAVPTDTLYVFPPTATPEQVTAETTIPSTRELYPSPDGTLIAAEYIFQVNNQPNFDIRLYTLSGQELGSPYISATSISDESSWLSDSSGLVLAPEAGSGAPLLIMDRQGNVRPLSLSMSNLELSPDGRWIGGTALRSDGRVFGAEIVPRGGGAARMLAPNGRFVGWQNGRAVYVTGGSATRYLYALDPSAGAPLLIAQYPPNNPCFGGPPYQNIGSVGSSPDGQVLLIASQCEGYKMLVGNNLLPFPSSLIQYLGPDPMVWVGPHDFIGIANQPGGSEGDYVIFDIITGKVIRDTGLLASFTGSIVALSGDWMATSSDAGQSLQLSLVNYLTRASYTIDPRLTSIVPLGDQGKFVCVETTVVSSPSSSGQLLASVYIIDPALIG